jgi:hypothetical protein
MDKIALTSASSGTSPHEAGVRDFAPTLKPSQLEFRIRLAVKRLHSYPADSLDFIMEDLEHPKDSIRHAHHCTADMTGRTIEFFGEAMQLLPDLDRKPAEMLFERMLKAAPASPHLARRFYPYYRLTKDRRALATILENLERCEAAAKSAEGPASFDSPWASVIEGMADRYAETRDRRWLDLAEAYQEPSLKTAGRHAHGRLTVLRALLKMARVSGERKFLDRVESEYPELLDAEHADGSIAETLPDSFRTEGCSIGDWLILNLRRWDLLRDGRSLDRAEHTLVNALWFNQFVTGGFGHRDFLGRGYDSGVEEAWWCCTMSGGMAMCEFARHAVQLVDGVIRINFLVPGIYRLDEGKDAMTVDLDSSYPARYEATVKTVGAGGREVVFRVPGYVKNAKTSREGDVWTLQGDIGHHAEKRRGGWTVKYGPLMLAPMIYYWKNVGKVSEDVPKGYVPESIEPEGFAVVEPKEKDGNGFWKVRGGPADLPEWPAYDDGRNSRTGTGFLAPAWLETVDGAGVRRELYFQPMSYQTSNLTLRYVPMVFGLIER